LTKMSDNSDYESLITSWICRDYPTTERYKALARRFYLSIVSHTADDEDSENAQERDSERARKEFAEYLRELFFEFEAKEIVVDRWSKGFETLEKITIAPVRLDKTDGAKEIDWDWIADYLLLAASVSWKEFEELNERRANLNQSYADRISANRKRIEKNNKFIRLVFDKILDQHEDIDLEKIAENVRQEHFPSFTKTGEQKGDSERSSEQKKILGFNPVPLMEDDAKVRKIEIPAISLYQPKYFVNKEQ